MERCKVLALLLCEKASTGPDGKLTLHGVFDRIIIPRAPAESRIFFVYYKLVVEQPCTVSLRVTDPLNGEIGGNWLDSWRDSIERTGPIQAIWALTTTLLKQPGPYVLELRQETNDSEALSLASTRLVVDEPGE